MVLRSGGCGCQCRRRGLGAVVSNSDWVESWVMASGKSGSGLWVVVDRG